MAGIDASDVLKRSGKDALGKQIMDGIQNSKNVVNNSTSWTDDMSVLVRIIIGQVANGDFDAHSQLMGHKGNHTRTTRQIVIVDYMFVVVNKIGLDIKQHPVLTEKDVKKALLFNGKYWQSLYLDSIRQILKGVCAVLLEKELTYQSPSFIRGLLDVFWDRATTIGELSLKRMLLNLDNGTLEFYQDGGIRLNKHAKTDSLQYCLPYRYDENAKSPLFDKFLADILDTESQTLLQEVIGAIFELYTKFEKIFVLYGGGSNGKSVFLLILKALFGDANVSNMSLKDLTFGDKAPNNRAQLIGKKINIAAEIDSKAVQDHALIKTLASREPTTFKWLYQDTFTTDNYAQLLFACNKFPIDVENSFGFFRRWLLIDFNKTIEEKDQDRQLARKIIENELPGILNWVITGFKRLNSNGKFSACKQSDKLLEEFKLQTDNVALFVQEYEYIPSSTDREVFSTVYKNYGVFCSDSNCKPVSAKTFGDRVRSLGFCVQKGTSNKTFINCKKSS